MRSHEIMEVWVLLSIGALHKAGALFLTKLSVFSYLYSCSRFQGHDLNLRVIVIDKTSAKDYHVCYRHYQGRAMNSLDVAFSAWLAFLSALSVDTDVVLKPPATGAEIQQLEEAIGFELPPELVALYKITNGQLDPYHVEPRTGQYAVALFGYYDFLSTTEVLQAYQFQQEIRDDFGNELDDEITVRNEDPVNAVDWQEGWLPIAGSGANHIAMDLTPLAGGTYGQLIPMGADEFERFVLADSLSDFFDRASNETGTDECALEYGVPDTSDAHVPEEHRISLNPYILYITAAWNHPFFEDNCAPQPVYEQPQYLNDANDANHRFIDWLVVQGISDERVRHIALMSTVKLSMLMEEKDPHYQQERLPDWLAPGGTVPEDLRGSDLFPEAQFPDGIIPMDFDIPTLSGRDYFSELGFQLACDKAVNNTDDRVLSLDEYRLFHQFLVMDGIWTDDDYQQAEDTMHKLPDVIAEGKASDGVYSCSSI